jgi:hypothetical protein
MNWGINTIKKLCLKNGAKMTISLVFNVGESPVKNLASMDEFLSWEKSHLDKGLELVGCNIRRDPLYHCIYPYFLFKE